MKQIDVIFASYLHAPIGPTGTLRRLLANRGHLASHGYDLNVFTIDGQNNGDEVQATPINFQRGLSFRSHLKQLIKRSCLLSALFQLREMRRNRQFVRRYLALKRTPNVAVFHDHLTAYYYLKMRAKDSSARTVLFQHNDGKKWVMELKTYPKLRHTLTFRRMDWQYEWTIRRVNRLVFIARVGLENFAEANGDIPRDRLSFFHNGIDMRPYVGLENGAPQYRLVTTGTVDKRKGQHLIIEALGRLPREIRKDFSLTILGTGPGVLPFRELARKYDLESQVHFEGRVPNEMVPAMLRKANVYVLMSNNEGLPISILEAMRAGLPVISTKIAGIPEQVRTGDNGVLVNPNVEELVGVLSSMGLYDWKAMGRRSRERFEREFTFEQMLEGYIGMLDRCVKC